MSCEGWAQGISDAAVDRTFCDGAILRTHVLRPTWHFLAPSDNRWMLELTAPRVHAVNGHIYRKLGFDDAVFRRANMAMTRATCCEVRRHGAYLGMPAVLAELSAGRS